MVCVGLAASRLFLDVGDRFIVIVGCVWRGVVYCVMCALCG